MDASKAQSTFVWPEAKTHAQNTESNPEVVKTRRPTVGGPEDIWKDEVDERQVSTRPDWVYITRELFLTVGSLRMQSLSQICSSAYSKASARNSS